MSLSAPRRAARRQPPGRRPAPVRPASGRLSRLDLKTSPYLYIAPFFIVFGVFGLYPMLWTLWMSLHDWNLVNADPGHAFIGLDNYIRLLHDEYFWNAVRNTFGMFLLADHPAAAAGAVPGEPAQPTAAAGARPSGAWPSSCRT